MTYKKAGVDIDKANAFVKRIKPLLDKTVRPEVLGKIGGFSGLFMPRLKGINNPVLVSATDGVGTKLLLAEMFDRYDSVGIDLVAMCVDDVVVTGAEPLFFLDYIACGKLNDKILYELIKGITKGCQEAGCALIGGETAELPGMYEKGRFDLAGFCVGIVDRQKMIDGRLCRKGDKIIGLASSGLHSNGYSLVRKVFSPEELKGRLGLELLRPTRIYARAILKILEKIRIKAMAHITGGGLTENIPRVLPSGLGAKIQKDSWPVPAIFRKIQDKSRLDEKEMFRTFNMGVGMALILGPQNARRALQFFEGTGEKAWMIGEVIEGAHGIVLQN
ncbi:MAG: phosphoribosylformylglycinamidine cyclo-ligase [Candidatus Aminicenantes bacterium]